MNFRKLLTYLTVGTAAVIPFAGAQNPTILQGSYISNVFGNSNFVLNPNAQTNVANVTNATRSISTPLVATSEFTLNLTSGTFATWTLRAFDGGMKGQNCEARFTYRGFATATTKAEIVQNSLVVASLTLTPTTDPRIASINFPCGDLVNATTFRIAQTTANMTTVTPNEIGGIYVGLATNMANVAQAEFVGRLTWPALSGSSDTSNTGAQTFTDFNAFTAAPSVTGNVTSPNNAPQITIPNMKPGNYIFMLGSGLQCYVLSGTSCSAVVRLIDTDGVVVSNVTTVRSDGATGLLVGVSSTTFEIQYNGPTATKTFKLQGKTSGPGAFVRVERVSVGNEVTLSAYRFPSSSELVVTPERQNVFGAFQAYGGASNAVTAATWTNMNNAGGQTRTTFGKATAPSIAGDFAIKIPSLPVGNFMVVFTGQAYAVSSASGVTTQCFFSISDGTNRSAVAVVDATGDATNTAQVQEAATITGVFSNTSIQDKTFFLQGYRQAGGGSCNVYADSARPYVITVIPLDQPSNSALYVQGPVQAAATGAAISAGYQGETLTASPISAVIPGASGAYKTVTSITLQPGIYWIRGTVDFSNISSTGGNYFETSLSTTADTRGSIETRHMFGFLGSGSYFLTPQYVTVTSPTTYHLIMRWDYTTLTTATYTTNSIIRAVRIN